MLLKNSQSGVPVLNQAFLSAWQNHVFTGLGLKKSGMVFFNSL
ncbi:hypothetical protein X474_09055 [Dethiosulfatarculus sandiegensis]|uniref:Uncharacterized protein n=1 Tax=Dethiosulfatarculus sandiegensis TaxID=1429043 RepID=A0A0D2JF86_9BACT|nr:hypothetical protein X474_09055 [Dethiosulfatarculus sandiegensis]